MVYKCHPPLPAEVPQIQESNVIWYGTSEASVAKGINMSQYWPPILSLD